MDAPLAGTPATNEYGGTFVPWRTIAFAATRQWSPISTCDSTVALLPIRHRSPIFTSWMTTEWPMLMWLPISAWLELWTIVPSCTWVSRPILILPSALSTAHGHTVDPAPTSTLPTT